MFDLLLTGGVVVNADKSERADVAVSDGKIAQLLPPGHGANAQVCVDASGMHLLPGLVDAHVHLREPGLTHKETFESGTSAAALGGVTTVLDMPTDEPWTFSAATLADKMALARDRIFVDVGFQVAVASDLANLADMAALGPVSIELFTADVPQAFLFDTPAKIIEAMRALAPFGILIGISPGDQSILDAALRAGGTDIAAFLASRPPLAEANGIARAVLAAADTGARIHIRQINSALGIQTWSRLKDLADASIETSPQCLFFSRDDYVARGAALKGSPPFRFAADVAALNDAVVAGLIDIVATDHAPHAAAEKAASYTAFGDIPGGMPGVQTLLSVMLSLVARKLITLNELVRVCSQVPAERFGIGARKGGLAPGRDADIVVLDPKLSTTIRDGDQRSLAGYTPFDGLTVPFKLRRVYLRGEEIVREGQLKPTATGKILAR